MILEYFENLFRYFTSDPIVSEVSQQKAALAKEDQSGVKKAADEEDGDIINNQPLSDLRALVENYGPLYQGMIIETDLQTTLEICPRKRRRSDAYNSLVNYLGREHSVTLMIKKKHGTERSTD